MEIYRAVEGLQMVEALVRGSLGYLLAGYLLDLLMCALDGQEPWLIQDVRRIFRRRSK
jgi:hypothetical protein